MSKILHKIDPSFSRCPACKGIGNLNRSRARTLKEKILKGTKIFRIYRCSDCGWRGIKFSFGVTKNFAKRLFYMAIVIVITAYIVSYFLSRYFN
ncbi:MAG: hypothetical protein AB9882_04885 [Ignavibacteriaceae bacterium]